MSSNVFRAFSISFVALFATASTLQADHHETVKGKVADLGWMTGSWVGEIGGNMLEENWCKPADGTIASIVRSRGDGKTGMLEIVYIEEQGDTLALYVQQWDPGYKARGDAQKMKLVGRESNMVSFQAEGEGGMKSLTYTRPSDDLFTIDVEVAGGRKFQIKLSPNE